MNRVGDGTTVPATGDGLTADISPTGVAVELISAGTGVARPGSTTAGAAQLTITLHPTMMLNIRCHMTLLPYFNWVVCNLVLFFILLHTIAIKTLKYGHFHHPRRHNPASYTSQVHRSLTANQLRTSPHIEDNAEYNHRMQEHGAYWLGAAATMRCTES
jgi:hypothetical protein